MKSAVQENEDADVKGLLSDMAAEAEDAMDRAEAAGGLTVGERNEGQYVMAFADEMMKRPEFSGAAAEDEKFAAVEREYMKRVSALEARADDIGRQLKNAFAFIRDNLGEGNEMLIFVTELTIDPASARFIAENGSDEYHAYNKKFMIYERNAELSEQVRRWRHLSGKPSAEAGGIEASGGASEEDKGLKEAAVKTIKLNGSDKNRQN